MRQMACQQIHRLMACTGYIKDPDVYRRVLVQGDLGLGESCLATSFRAGKIVTKKIPLIKSYITYITYITYHRNNIVKTHEDHIA